MGLLKKEQALYPNDGNKLLPIEVELVDIDEKETKKSETKEKTTVKLIPMTREQIREFYDKAEVDDENKSVKSKKDSDEELIERHMVEPSFTAEELKFLKPIQTKNIVLTILKASDQNIDYVIGKNKSLTETKDAKQPSENEEGN